MPDLSRFEKTLLILREALANVPDEMKFDGSTIAADSNSGPILIYAWGSSARGLRMLLGLPMDPEPVELRPLNPKNPQNN